MLSPHTPLLLQRAISSSRRTISSDSIASQHQLMIALSGPVKALSRLLFNRVHDT